MQLPAKLSESLTAVGKFATAMGLIGFVAALFTNQAVFQLWGLNFLQVASIGDVILTPITILLWMMPIVVAVGIGISLAMLPFKPIRRATINKITVTVTAICLALIFWKVRKNSFPGLDISKLAFTSVEQMLSVSLFAGFFGTSILKEVSNKVEVIIFGGYIFLFIVTFVMATLVFVENGFVGRSSMASETCWTGSINVLWVGERAVVGRCISDGALRVVINPETQTIYVPLGRGTPSYEDRLFGVPTPPS